MHTARLAWNIINPKYNLVILCELTVGEAFGVHYATISRAVKA